MFKGSITALITPFTGGEIDWKRFDAFVEWQIEKGSHGVVPCGTTGESPTVTHDDHKAIIQRCVQVVDGRIPVIAGTGSNSTAEAIELTTAAKNAGADGCLVVTPYYNKPTQDGMIAHFTAIHDAVDLPMVLYDIPGRSVVEMNVDTIVTLSHLDHVVGLKDATNDLSRVCAMRAGVADGFTLLSGEDPTVPGFYALGGDGCISVVANIAPDLCAKLYESWIAKDLEEFARVRDLIAPLGTGLFCESSPAPVKYAAAKLGLCDQDIRLPLMPLTAGGQKIVDAALAHAGLGQ